MMPQFSGHCVAEKGVERSCRPPDSTLVQDVAPRFEYLTNTTWSHYLNDGRGVRLCWWTLGELLA
jgi:hypothetical protein